MELVKKLILLNLKGVRVHLGWGYDVCSSIWTRNKVFEYERNRRGKSGTHREREEILI